jgi:signal peptidase I
MPRSATDNTGTPGEPSGEERSGRELASEDGAGEGSESARHMPTPVPRLMREREENRRLRLLVRILSIAAVVLILVRVFVLEPYGIPTGSMRPTIVEGDVLLACKLPYTIRSLRYIPFTHIQIPFVELPGIGRLERGDVIVFDYPHHAEVDPDEGSAFVKRCVAIRGDTVQLVEGRIRVNGAEVPPVYDPDEPERTRRAPVARGRAVPILREGNPIIVPYKGFEVPMDSVTLALWQPWIEDEGVRVEYRNRIVFLDGLPATRYIFRHDYFFALGDNSAVSKDSRYFGFVPYENLIGRAWIIYWSRDPYDGVRWGRIGKLVR